MENVNELVSATGIINVIKPNGSIELAIAITSNYINAYEYKLIAE